MKKLNNAKRIIKNNTDYIFVLFYIILDFQKACVFDHINNGHVFV
jgi:hypothetical protein